MNDRIWKTEKYHAELEAPVAKEVAAKIKKDDSGFLMEILTTNLLAWYTDGLSEQSPNEAALEVLFKEGGDLLDATNYVTFEDFVGAKIWVHPNRAVMRLYRPHRSEEDWARFKHEHHIADF